MTRIFPNREGNLNGVVAGAASTGRLQLPIGVRYHWLAVKWTYDAITFNLADMTEIRVKVNGKSILQLSATLIDLRNKILGMSASGTTGILMIPFERKNMKLRNQEEDTVLNTGVPDTQGREIKTLDIEIDFSGDQTTAGVVIYSGISSKILTNKAGAPYGPGTIMHTIRHPYRALSGAGDLTINDLPRRGPEFKALERMIISSSNDVITDVEIKKNKNTVHDIPCALQDVLLPNGVRANSAGYQIVDFTYLGDGRPDTPLALVDADSFDVILTASGDMGSDSASFIIADYLGTLGK